MVITGSLANKRTWHHPKEATSGSLQLQIWQWTMPSLSQRLGSFPTESRADNFSQCRKDFSLALPINRGGFDDLKEEKIGFKVSQKTSLPSFLSPCRFSSSASSSFFLRYRKPTPPSFLPPAPPWATSTAKRPPNSHRDSLPLLLPAFLSPLQIFLLPPIADSGHHHLGRCLLSYQPNILSTSTTPTPDNILLPVSPPSSSRSLHAEFISACND